jgi:hypothetical protein
MRHYDRADFRHLNDGERYRDYDYVAEDGWAQTEETRQMRAERMERDAEREAERQRAKEGGPSSDTRRGRVITNKMNEPPEPLLQQLLGALFHPRQALRRAVHGALARLRRTKG